MKIGELTGVSKGLSKDEFVVNMINQMMSEAIKTSEIEGEFFSREDVMSSIKNNLGLNKNYVSVRNPKADQIGKIVVEIRENYAKKMTESQLKHLHLILMENEKSVTAGKWRTGKQPMQIVSGAFGKEKIHFEAPPSEFVPQEIKNFVKWYNSFTCSATDFDEILIKTAITHLYFESIHPFEDGNGRIGRVIAEKCFFQSVGNYLPISFSTIIEKDKKAYHQNLKLAQQTLEITSWIVYFSKVVLDALIDAQEKILFTMSKTRFFDEHKEILNNRQVKAIRKIFEEGTNGFEGGMTAKKYMSITKTSKATATRDLQDLVGKGIFSFSGMGRNVSYALIQK